MLYSSTDPLARRTAKSLYAEQASNLDFAIIRTTGRSRSAYFLDRNLFNLSNVCFGGRNPEKAPIRPDLRTRPDERPVPIAADNVGIALGERHDAVPDNPARALEAMHARYSL